ncbi:MAG: hypothetical protein ACAI35_08315 [Candidatus Methylacidiphilales bacterium]|nr:hypothetical protein [Candidatus Methylacidiphilales bacterium]
MPQYILILQLHSGDRGAIQHAIKAKFSATDSAPADLNATDGKPSDHPSQRQHYLMPDNSYYVPSFLDAYKLSESVVTEVEQAGGIAERVFVAAIDSSAPDYYCYDRNGSPSAMDISSTAGA